jgi:CheY-like chemotaxis protein
MRNPGLLLSDDLLFISKITGTAHSLGLEVKSARTPADALAKAQARPLSCVLIDLQNPGLDVAAFVKDLSAAGSPYIVAYGSHVDAASLKAASDAGCHLVLPRSKFVDQLNTELPKWMGI